MSPDELNSSLKRRPFVPFDCRMTPSFEIKRVLRQIREEPRSAADSPLRSSSRLVANC